MGRCWPNYKPAPGKTPYSKGSCIPRQTSAGFKMKGPVMYQGPRQMSYGDSANSSTTQQPMLSEYKEDNLFTKLKTIVNNPFDALKVAYQGGRSDQGDYTHSSLTNLRRAKEAADAGNEDAQRGFARTKGINTVASLTPYAMFASTVADVVSGDPTGAILKKFNKIPGVSKVIKDPKKAAMAAKGAYKSYKTNKTI